MEERILLVEDDLEIGRIIRDTLQSEHYRITWATTGLEGWEDFQSDQYDLVLADWMLPEMDGITLCKNIRLASDVPIIMISARREDEDKVTGLDIGADDYLAKPFSLQELKARVASQLRRWRRYSGLEQPADQTTYAHGLLVDWQNERVFLHHEEVLLTIKEFELLKLLARHPEKVFSKEELYHHVWQQPELGETHTVTVHVKALREKLQDLPKKPHYIQTVWGKGYRFIGDIQ